MTPMKSRSKWRYRTRLRPQHEIKSRPSKHLAQMAQKPDEPAAQFFLEESASGPQPTFMDGAVNVGFGGIRNVAPQQTLYHALTQYS